MQINFFLGWSKNSLKIQWIEIREKAVSSEGFLKRWDKIETNFGGCEKKS